MNSRLLLLAVCVLAVITLFSPLSPSRSPLTSHGPIPISSSRPSDSLHEHIMEASELYEIDPALILAVIKTESGFNPRIVSAKGAMGLMQLMPQTARAMGVADPFDPRENILGGVRYINTLRQMFGGDLDLVLAGYNAGPARVRKLGRIPRIPETEQYVATVKETWESIRTQH